MSYKDSNWSEYDKTIWRYNKQIENRCRRSKIDKKLFEHSQRLSLDDWRKIRGKEFWELYDEIESPIDRNEFTLETIKTYLEGG